MEKVIRVILVDDSPDEAEILGYVIRAESGIEYVGCLKSADGLSQNVRALAPDVLLLDARMPGKDSIAAMRELSDEFPNLRTIMYSGLMDPRMIQEAIDAGAWGWVRKGDDPRAVIKAIRTVAAGKAVFPRRRAPLGGIAC